MALSEFDKKRIDTVVGAFIDKHRPPAHIRKDLDLGYRISGQSVEIFEIRPVWRGNGEYHDIAVAKATFVKTQQVWKLYWQRQDLRWHGYEPKPQARTLEEVLAEIEADPWHCFWG
ncbi:MAG: DUF3024 domain-containing protein [Pseudomonadota bacterium]